MSDSVDTEQASAQSDDPGREALPGPPSGFNLPMLSYHAKGAIAVLISLAVLIGGGWFVMTEVTDRIQTALTAEDYPGPGNEDIVVQVPQGASAGEVGDILVAADVIRSTEAWDEALTMSSSAVNLKAGYYQLKTQMNAADALDAMSRPDALQQAKVTVREGLRLDEQYAQLSKATKIGVEEFDQAGKDGSSYQLSSWANGNPEGFLFPDTYFVQSAAGPTPVLAQMAKQFDKVAADIDLEAKAKAMGRSPRDLVIVASIIEEEVRRPEDRPKVARVLYNRLDKNMKLELDTTVMYANDARGGASTTQQMRDSDSPYNTYRVTGLPPGPISAPGKSALEAAANPADGNWLFFVAVDLDSGRTEFADDAAGHQRNVETWRRWCSQNKGKC